MSGFYVGTRAWNSGPFAFRASVLIHWDFSNLETWTWMRTFTYTVTKSPLIPCPVGQTFSLRRLGKQQEEQRLLIIPKKQSASISQVSNQLKTGTNHLLHNLAIIKSPNEDLTLAGTRRGRRWFKWTEVLLSLRKHRNGGKHQCTMTKFRNCLHSWTE